MHLSRIRCLLPALIAVSSATLFSANPPVSGRGSTQVNIAELTASDGAQQNGLGGFVAMSGTMIAAAGNQKIYVFEEPSNGWQNMTQTAELSASDGTGLSAVAIDSNVIVAGATAESAVYVFVKPADGWTNMTETAILSSTDQASNLGISVSISGNTVVAGSSSSQNGFGPSTAYVFVEPADGWTNMTQTAELTPSDGGGPFFAAAVSGGTIVAGGLGTTVGSNNAQGAAYVYVRPVGGWVSMTESARLTASDGAAGDVLGTAVAINGGTIVAGAPGATMNGRLAAGASYVFVRPTGGWRTMTQTAKLTASDAKFKAEMGSSLSATGSVIVSGAPQQPIGKTQIQGAAYTFAKPATGWASKTQTARLTASDGSGGLASGVAASGGTVAAGAPFTTVGSNKLQGAVYVFTQDATRPKSLGFPQ